MEVKVSNDIAKYSIFDSIFDSILPDSLRFDSKIFRFALPYYLAPGANFFNPPEGGALIRRERLSGILR